MTGPTSLERPPPDGGASIPANAPIMAATATTSTRSFVTSGT